MFDVSTSLLALSLPSASQGSDGEYELRGEQEYDTESEDSNEDILISPFVFYSPKPVISPPAPVPLRLVSRLNPDAPSFIPRRAVLVAVPVSIAEVRPLSIASDPEVDDARSPIEDKRFVTALPHECELQIDICYGRCPVIHSTWPAETKDPDDLAFLMYFGLIDRAPL